MTRLTCRSRTRRVGLFNWVAGVAALVLWATASTGTPSPDPPRVVAIGDIHGAYDQFVAILERTGLIDQTKSWSGGRATLVQTGDFMDRGAQVRAVMDLLRALERQAHAAGGEVIVLLGNHEAMNMIGLVRDVTPAIFGTFVDRRSPERREKVFRQYVEWTRDGGSTAGDDGHPQEVRQTWMDAHPLGLVEYLDALGPDGEYGRWLRQKRVVVQVGETIFVHGGISETWTLPLDEINDRMQQEMAAFDRHRKRLIGTGVVGPSFTFSEMLEAADRRAEQLIAARREQRPLDDREISDQEVIAALRKARGWMAIDPNGPLWFRGYAFWSPEEGAVRIGPLLERYGARHFVVGHTIPSTFRIAARFSRRVFLIDTAMLSSYYPGGRPSALVIEDGQVTAVYLDGEEKLSESQEGQPAAGAAVP